MTASTAKVSWFRRSRIRVLIWLLQALQRIIQTAWFRAVLLRVVVRPALRVGAVWFIYALFFDRLPDSMSANPQVAQLRMQVKAYLDARVRRGGASEGDRSFVRTMTWGTAGVGVVILTTIVAARVFSPAMLVATAAFALAIPFLVACNN
jgi:hypothetical protein